MLGRERFQFGDFTLDVDERRLSQPGREAVRLAPKAFDLLVALVRESGRLITKEELLARVWPDSFVEEGILTVHIASLRKALDGSSRRPSYIETVPRSGYRFVAPVKRSLSSDDPLAERAIFPPTEVYELVGRGRSHLLSGSYFELPDAVTAFRAAIETDPTYAAAHAGLALTRCAQASLRMMPHLEAYADAKGSALRALAMDDGCADAQVALGSVLFLSEWDWTGAERSLRRALDINPAHPEGLLQYGSLMEALGHLEQGLRFKQQALERDSRSPLIFVQIALSYWHQRQYDNAITWATRALDLDPRHLLAGEFLAGAYWKKGDIESFLAEQLRRAEVFGVPDATLAHLKRVCAEMKDAYAAGGPVKLTRYMLEQMPRTEGGAASVQLAVLQGSLGNLDAAFEHLDRAVEARDPALVHLAVAPQWDSLRADVRFQQRLAKIGLVATPGPFAH
jgi:DNA-binding winged helix-turn-helix (wHTH) protein